MENRVLSFCIILYIVIFYRIVLESLGILVSSDFIFSFYIFVYLNGQASLFHCRSPPISTNFFRDSCWLEVFYMDENPKRIKKKDDPYTIKKVGNEYIISFKDALGILQEIKVTKEVYAIFDKSELQDKREMNEFDRHIEHSEIYEDNLVIRAKEKTISMEDEFIQKATFEELKRAIEMLPEIQKRRIKKYYFDDKDEYEIATEEFISVKNVSVTLKSARENLKKILKKLI